MVIFRNIPAFFKLISSLRYLKTYRKNIDEGRASGDIEKEKENIMLSMKDWSPRIIKALGVELNIAGKENLPDKGPAVFVSNHQGYSDILVLCAVIDTVQFGFVAKENLVKMPFYGRWIDRTRGVLIERDDAKAAVKAILKGIDLLKQGFSLVIFPEGTRSKSSKMGTFKKGALKLATKPGVPIIPITLDGTYNIYEATGIIRGAHVDVTIHPAIETKNLDKRAEYDLAGRVEDIVRSGLPPMAEKNSKL